MRDSISNATDIKTDPAGLGQVVDLAARLAASPRLENACEQLLAAIADQLSVDRASILVLDPELGHLSLVAARGLPINAGEDNGKPRHRSISQWVLMERQPLLLNGEVRNESFVASAADVQIQSSISVPLLAPTGPVGVLNVARLTPATPFETTDLALAVRLGEALSSVVERIQQDRLAHECFGQLLAAQSGPASGHVPCGLTEISNYQMGYTRRTSRRMGSHLLDRVAHKHGAHSLALIDVAGFGPTAAASAAFLQGLFVTACSAAGSASELVTRINGSLRHRMGARPGAGLWVAQLSGSGAVRSCAVCVPPPLWVPADHSDIIPLGSSSDALGLDFDRQYEEESIQLLPGDTIAAVSPGVLSARSPQGQAFGTHRLAELLNENRNQAPGEVSETVCNAVLAHTACPVPFDDLSVLIVRFTPDRSD